MACRLFIGLLAAAFCTGCTTHSSPPNFHRAASNPVPVKKLTIPACADDASWNDPVQPRRMYGNTYYVGTCAVSAILVTSPAGHILFDGATAAAADQIENNIRALGFRVEDIRYILVSHEHFDHVGGVAQLQARSGAVVIAREVAAEALERGQNDRRDPQLLQLQPFLPVAAVRRIVDGEHVSVGRIVVTVHATPGHTPGSTSWTWQECANGRCVNIAYVDSLTPLTDSVFRYSDEASHPGYVGAFRRSIGTVSTLPCDILITPHPQASQLWTRLSGQTEAKLIDANACARYANIATIHLNEKIAAEQARHGL